MEGKRTLSRNSGIARSLASLREAGLCGDFKTGKLIIRHFDFERYIDDLVGAEATGKHSGKGQLIAKLMERHHIQASPFVVMIGDTHYDMIGAKENTISGIAVSYGYGYGNQDAFNVCSPDYIADTVGELAGLLLG